MHAGQGRRLSEGREMSPGLARTFSGLVPELPAEAVVSPELLLRAISAVQVWD
jgi:hypothetical protein